jgi:DNA-binding transcriptional ArsR family regulator
MTRHEALTYLNMCGEPLSKNNLRQYFSLAYTTASEAVNRMQRDGLVEAIRIVGREVYYGLTVRGIKRLDFFDQNGCNNEGCECHR